MPRFHIKISHWLPIVTFCPVNGLPDVIYVTVTFKNKFVELYALRKKIRKIASGRKIFMEDLCKELLEQLEADFVEVKLLTGRHVVKYKKG